MALSKELVRNRDFQAPGGIYDLQRLRSWAALDEYTALKLQGCRTIHNHKSII